MLILELPETHFIAGQVYGPYLSSPVSAELSRYRIELDPGADWPYQAQQHVQATELDDSGRARWAFNEDGSPRMVLGPADVFTVAVEYSTDGKWGDTHHFRATFSANQLDRAGQPLSHVMVERDMGVLLPHEPGRRVLTTAHADLFRVTVTAHLDCRAVVRLTGDA